MFYIPGTIYFSGLDVTTVGNTIDIFASKDITKNAEVYTISVFNNTDQLVRKFLFTYTSDINVPSDYPIIKISQYGKIYPTFAQIDDFPFGGTITASGKYGFIPIQNN